MYATNKLPHRRYNPLSGQWLLLSPHRTQRPWQGKKEDSKVQTRPEYESSCYLCPGNKRMNGIQNDDYTTTFVFDNDFKALGNTALEKKLNEDDLYLTESADGTCRVICYSPRHDLTLAEMDKSQLEKVVELWKTQTSELSQEYQWVQIFENKGEIMGCSNPHPHGQIWASNFIPEEPFKEDIKQQEYLAKHGKNLLLKYIVKEREKNLRIVVENDHWIHLVPYWAVWPFETLLLPKKHTLQLSDLDAEQSESLADILKVLLVKYDNLFETSFPYSMGWHGAPSNGADNNHWQLHAHYYPPLLRSADIKKFMVGYEMLGCAQRDILPETAAEMLRSQPERHYNSSR